MCPFSFTVTDQGKLPDGIRRDLAHVIPQYAGKHMRIILEEVGEKRSLKQNDSYRASILPHVRKVMMECGDARSLDHWHEVLIEEFSPTIQVTLMNGEVKMRPLRTHEMTKEQMSTFITSIIAEMASRGYPVPIREE